MKKETMYLINTLLENSKGCSNPIFEIKEHDDNDKFSPVFDEIIIKDCSPKTLRLLCNNSHIITSFDIKDGITIYVLDREFVRTL